MRTSSCHAVGSDEHDVGGVGEELQRHEFLDGRAIDLRGRAPVEVGDRLELPMFTSRSRRSRLRRPRSWPPSAATALRAVRLGRRPSPRASGPATHADTGRGLLAQLGGVHGCLTHRGDLLGQAVRPARSGRTRRSSWERAGASRRATSLLRHSAVGGRPCSSTANIGCNWM